MLENRTKRGFNFYPVFFVIMFCFMCSLSACSDKSTDNSGTSGAGQENNYVNNVQVNGFEHGGDNQGYYSAVEWVADISANETVLDYSLNDTAAYYVVRAISDGVADYGRLHRVDFAKMYELSGQVYRVNGMVSNSKSAFGEIGADITPAQFEDMNVVISSIYAVSDGVYVLAYSDAGDGVHDYSMYKIDSDGNIISCTELGSSIISQVFDMGEQTIGVEMLGKMLVKEQAGGFLMYFGFFGGDSIIVAVNDRQELVGNDKISHEIYDMAMAGDGTVYLVYGDGNGTGIACYNEKDGISDMGSMVGMSGNEAVCPDFLNGTGFVYSNVNGAYRFDTTDKTYSQFIKWSDVGIKDKEADAVYETGEGRFVSVGKKNDNGGVLPGFSLIYLERSDEEYTGQRQKVTIGTWYESDALADMVRLFNSSNSMYEAQVVIYDDFEKLGAELMSGKGPDLFDAGFVDLAEYAKAGIVEDLNKYLDSGRTQLSRDMLLEPVIDVYTKDGVLACIPPTFSVDCFVGRENILGDDGSMSRRDFFEALKNNQGINIVMPSKYSGEPAGEIARLDYMANKDFYVDMDNYTARFDSDEFLESLELTLSHNIELYDSEQMTLTEQLDEGRLMLFAPLTGVDSVRAYLTLREMAAGEGGVIVGYPRMDGSTAYGVTTSEGYAMNVNSADKDAAWAFIEFSVMINSNTKKNMDSEFPTLKSALEEIFQVCSQVNVYDEFGNLQTDNIDENDIECIRTLIDNMSIVTNLNSKIDNVVDEEINNMLSGASSPGETAAVIQSRVQIMLDEMR